MEWSYRELTRTYESAAQTAAPHICRTDRLKQTKAIQVSTHLIPCLKLAHLFPEVCDPETVCGKAIFSLYFCNKTRLNHCIAILF